MSEKKTKEEEILDNDMFRDVLSTKGCFRIQEKKQEEIVEVLKDSGNESDLLD